MTDRIGGFYLAKRAVLIVILEAMLQILHCSLPSIPPQKTVNIENEARWEFSCGKDRDGSSRVLLRLVMFRKKQQARINILESTRCEIHCCLNYSKNVYKDIVKSKWIYLNIFEYRKQNAPQVKQEKRD